MRFPSTDQVGRAVPYMIGGFLILLVVLSLPSLLKERGTELFRYYILMFIALFAYGMRMTWRIWKKSKEEYPK